MELKFLNEYDVVNYKKPNMFIGFPHCTFKCGKQNCQNYSLIQQDNLEVTAEEIVQKYLTNPLTHAIVIGGLEPFDDFDDLLDLVSTIRKYTEDDIVIYSGWHESELYEELSILKQYKNIIVKFGRYIPDEKPFFDELLGVTLAGRNQYSKEL